MRKEWYVQFIDVNVDGCGTDVSTMAIISGNTPFLTNETLQNIQNAIHAYKESCDGEYDTNGCLQAAEEQLMLEGYEVEWFEPTEVITF